MNSNGVIVYDGPSMLDGEPILAILTGLEKPSKNDKTEDMLQLFIILRDVNPVDAIMDGLDSSICGDCKLRGENGKDRACYVDVAKSVQSVWNCYQRGNYPREFKANWRARMLRKGRKIALRLGAYGDPAALPIAIIDKLFVAIKPETSTGYTHQWANMRSNARLKRYCMASVDSVEEYAQAKALGWRTFRVRNESESLGDLEVVCPAADESPSSNVMSCARCGLCNGLQSARVSDAVIIVHGVRKGNFSLNLV